MGSEIVVFLVSEMHQFGEFASVLSVGKLLDMNNHDANKGMAYSLLDVPIGIAIFMPYIPFMSQNVVAIASESVRRNKNTLLLAKISRNRISTNAYSLLVKD